MPKVDLIQTNFTSGEVSPLMLGRVDVNRYFNGAEKIENFVVRPQGGIERRVGSIFISEVKDSSRRVVLQEFEFSTVQAYVLEFGHEYIRVYRDGGVVESSPGVPVEVVSPYQEDELTDLSFAQSADVLYICHHSHPPQKLSRSSDTSWTLSTFVSKDGPYLPYNETDLSVTVSAIVDRMTITSTASDFVVGDVGKYLEYSYEGETTIAEVMAYVSPTEITVRPMENVVASLNREVTFESFSSPNLTASHAVFHRGLIGAYIKLSDVGGGSGLDNTWRLISNYNGANEDKVVLTGSALTMVTAPTGAIHYKDRIVTATITATDDLFVATDATDSRLLRMSFDDEQVWATITGFTNTKVVTATLSRILPLKETKNNEYVDDGKTKLWRLGAWSTVTGWPSCVTFHEERLIFAASSEQPQTIWFSMSGQYDLFSPTEEDTTVNDDNGITYTIASNQVDTIEWLNSGPVLLIGTSGGEWQAKASSINEPITPTNAHITRQTSHGSNAVKPQRIASSVLFVERSGSKLRELVYSFEIDSFVGHDLTIVSEHILRDGQGTIDSAYQQVPNSIFWVVRNDGQLVGVTHVKEQEVAAWHRHVLGGSFAGGQSVVESIASIPSADATSSVLYLSVKRTINGVTKRYIEYFSEDFTPTSSTDKDGMQYLDSLLTYTGASSLVISGLDHLEGQTVGVVRDGAVHPTRVVTGGAITLQTAGSLVHVGLPYTSYVKSLPPEGQSDFGGTTQGKLKRIDHLTVRVLNSIGLKYRGNTGDYVQYSMRTSTGLMDVSPELYTGDIRIALTQDYDRLANYWLAQDQPYPLTILAVMPELRTH